MEEVTQDKFSDSHLIGFVDVAKFDEGKAYRGACLVTDIKTYPIECRITSPIRPTNLQSILYGSSMEECIFLELVTIPLIKAIKTNLSLVIVKKEMLLGARPNVPVPMVYVGDNELKLHDDFQNEGAIVKEIISLTGKSRVIEPFSRIQSAMAEAHMQGIGE